MNESLDFIITVLFKPQKSQKFLTLKFFKLLLKR